MNRMRHRRYGDFEEIRFNPEAASHKIETWIQENYPRQDEWWLMPKVEYKTLDVGRKWLRYKELVVEIHPDLGPGSVDCLRLIAARRRMEKPPHTLRMDEMEVLAYAWMLCLYVQAAAVQQPYHQPRVELYCRANPLSDVRAEVRVSR